MNPQSEIVIGNICGLGISFSLEGFHILYAVIATFMWVMAILFSKEYMAHYENKGRYYVFTVITYLGTIGVFLSADLFTLFLFFEIMSLASYVWVAQDEKKESLRAGDTYLAIAVMGGMVLLMGIFLLYDALGVNTLKIDRLSEILLASSRMINGKQLYAAGGCMLFGFLAKAGAFPLHIWLPKAHPVAPAPASALLSGVLTKTGIYGGLILSCQLFFADKKWGSLILFLGTITMFLGAVLALFSTNLKQTLACSSVSQIGFILVGMGALGFLGSEGAIAARGTLLHMVNHSMIKLTLFMAAGVVYMNIHELNLNKIRGFGRKKPLLMFIFLMGALSIMGVPFFSGYISKTLLHEAIMEVSVVAEWIFLISGGLTAAYMTKLFVAIFVEKNEDETLQKQYDEKKSYMNPVSSLVLMISALFMPIAGIMPYRIMDKIADFGQGFFRIGEMEHAIAYFSFANLKGSLISIAIGAVVYLIIVRKCLMKNGEYCNRWPKWLDLEDFLYRPLLLKVFPFVFGVICRVLDSVVDTIVVFLRKTIFQDSELPVEPEEGNEFTQKVGGNVDRLIRFLNRNVWSYHPHTDNVEHRMALGYQQMSESNAIISRSMSFGLLLACVGLALVLLYLLL